MAFVVLPDKTKIFLASFWVWTWLLLQINKFCSLCLNCVLAWVPDNCIPVIVQKSPIKVIEARDEKRRIITNKLNLFLNLKWRNTPYDRESIDIDKFAQYVGSSVIWVAYILDYKINPLYDEFINSVKEKRFKSKDINKLLYIVIIDVKNKLFHKNGIVENLLFGEVDFHED